MGIVEMNAVALALVVASAVWSKAIERAHGRSRPLAICRGVAIATWFAEVGVQIYAWQTAVGAIGDAPAEEKATRLARGVSLGLNAAAIEVAIEIAIVAVVAGSAISAKRRAIT